MADNIPFGGGGGVVIDEFVSVINIATASLITGDVLTISPPQGELVVLTSLRAYNVSSPKTGVSVVIGGRVVIDSKTLDKNGGVGSFAISTALLQPPIIGGVNETLIVNVADSTNGDIDYSYKFAKQ